MPYFVHLTNRYESIINWAIDPMYNYFCLQGSNEPDGTADSGLPIQDADQLPRVKSHVLFLADNALILDDLLYRIEIQYADLSIQDGQHVLARAAGYLADEIRSTTGYRGPISPCAVDGYSAQLEEASKGVGPGSIEAFNLAWNEEHKRLNKELG